jgi:hypothetical protein
MIPSFLASARCTDPCYVCSSPFDRLTKHGKAQFDELDDNLEDMEADIAQAVLKSGRRQADFATRLEVKRVDSRYIPTTIAI